ncbi:MAG: hypothetical protein KY455_03315 [Euryarchaeota archaeon]|nr:hypothetical protein [Euryarchaeota archaeon]
MTPRPEEMGAGVRTDDAADDRLRTAGGWAAAAALVLTVSIALHPPPSPVLSEFMGIVADSGTTFVVAHWLAAIGLSFFVVASLLVLTAGSRLTTSPWTLSAWALLPVGAMWVMTTAVAEATVMVEAAKTGNVATFETWQLFAEGKSMGFLALALSVAVIAGAEARAAAATTPRWAAWLASAAAAAAFAGWTLMMVADIMAGGPVWLVSSLLFGLWFVWFGIGLVRAGQTTRQKSAVHA